MELASLSGTYQLMYAMLNTTDIYRFNIGNIGLLTLVRYDVTDYETGNRREKSPLKSLTRGIPNKEGCVYNLKRIVDTPLLTSWR